MEEQEAARLYWQHALASAVPEGHGLGTHGKTIYALSSDGCDRIKVFAFYRSNKFAADGVVVVSFVLHFLHQGRLGLRKSCLLHY